MSDDPHVDPVGAGRQGLGQDSARQDPSRQDTSHEDPSHEDPSPQDPGRLDGPPPVSPHLLTWWFGLMAIGGVAFGLQADEHPFGRGMLAHPLVVFAACVLAGLLTLRFLQARPVLRLISAPSLAAGAVIGAACFFLGKWFGVSLTHMP